MVATASSAMYFSELGIYADPFNTGIAPTFETPDFATELEKCQRYYEKTYNYEFAPGSVSSAGGVAGARTTTASDYITFQFKVPKRATPTVSTYSGVTGASGMVRDISGAVDVAGTAQLIGTSSCAVSWTPAAAGRLGQAQFVVNARM
jgi:hypothetical protein